jgi:hypothetical protein
MSMRIKLRTPSILWMLVISFVYPPAASAAADRPFFSFVESSSVNLLREYPGVPLTEMIDERRGVYGGYEYSPTGATISIRSIFGWGPAVSAIAPDGSSYGAAFPPCFSAAQSDCISRIYLINANNIEDDAKPIKELPPQLAEYGSKIPEVFKTFSANKSLNRPAGGNLWMWKFNKFQHRGGSLILPSVLFEGTRKLGDKNSDPFRSPIVRIGMYPVAMDAANSCISDGKGGCSGYVGVLGAIKSVDGSSIVSDKLLEGQKLGIEFRSSVAWTRWSAATINEITFEHRRSGQDYVYNISGAPAVIPGVTKNVAITPENESVLREIAGGNFNCPQGADKLSLCNASISIGGKDGAGSSDFVYKLLEKVEPLTDGRSSVAIQHWLIQTNINSEDYSRLECVKNYTGSQPGGISSSNATLAQDSPPVWDAENQSFTYRVAAFGKLPDGKLFKGDYSLFIPTEIAKCLWAPNLTNARLQLSVINSDGTPNIATVTTKISAEKFAFHAAGFHFSSPKLVARVVSSKTSERRPVAAKKTITCVKGKLIKKVTGLEPKCPTGYKKR